MTDRVSERYVQECLAGGGLRTAMLDAELPPALFSSAGQRLLDRPLFAGGAEMQAFADDVIGLFGLITSLPERLFDGDLDRYCAALRIDGRRAALMRRLGGGKPPLYGRADMYHTGRQVAQALRAAGAGISSGREPVVALLEGPGGMARYGGYWLAVQELMRGLGLDMYVGEVGEVYRRGGKLCLGGAPVDVILRCFSVDEICATPAGEELVEPIFRAHEEGSVVLWTPMESSLFGNKGCLALLSDRRWRATFSRDELALIDRVLPWTRALDGEPAPGDQDLVEYCRERREELILKPNAEYGGTGIVAGWETTDQDWWRALKDGCSGGYVVQRRVVPRLEPVVDATTGRLEDWQAAWGMFVTPDGYAGAYARALPAGESAVIGIGANAKTRTAGVFVDFTGTQRG